MSRRHRRTPRVHLVVVPLLLFALVCVRNAAGDLALGLDLLLYLDVLLGFAALAVVAWIVARSPR